MDTLKSIRILVLAVALIDLLCWYLSLWYTELELLRGVALRFLQTGEEAGTKPEVSAAFFPVQKLGASTLAEIVIKLAVVCSLLKACQESTPPRSAVTYAKIYRTYSLIIILRAFVLYALVTSLDGHLQFSGFQQLSYFLRLLSLGVVHQFLGALRQNIRQRQLEETNAEPKN